MSAIEEFKKLMKQANEGNFEIDPEPIVEQIEESAEQPKISPLEELKNLLREAAPHYIPKEVVEENLEEEVKNLSSAEIIQMTADLLSPNINRSIAENIEAERWNDPLAQPNKEFVTLKQMNDHYNLFLGRIQQQMQSIGGSGEVNFRYLDDVNRARMTPSNDNWVLEYDVATKKVQFTEDLGPLKTIKFNTAGPDITRVPGTLSWNATEDCLNIDQADGSTLQTGLEHYVRVHNDSGVDIVNGDVIRLDGVLTDTDGTPLCRLMNADTLQNDRLFVLGLATNDIAQNGYGRLTVFGKVRGIDTTGTNVGEVWLLGDILWVHPTVNGRLTKIKPTAPDLTISVAMITKLGLDGSLLINPNFSLKPNYGVFANTVDHLAANTNEATAIGLDNTGDARGFSLAGLESSEITCEESGLYNFAVSYQILSNNSSAKQVYFWVRKNGVDIPYTTRRQTITGNNIFRTFGATWNVSMLGGDNVQLMWATTSLTAFLAADPSAAFAPSAPSVLLSITQASL